jgi:hypothetical protein
MMASYFYVFERFESRGARVLDLNWNGRLITSCPGLVIGCGECYQYGVADYTQEFEDA